MTYTESTGHMAVFQYGFFSCRGVHSSPWLTMAPWLSGELSRPDISLARVELVLRGTLGDERWWHSSTGCSWGASQWFPSLQGWGGDTSTRLTAGFSVGTTAFSWWQEEAALSEASVCLVSPGDLCTRKVAPLPPQPPHTPWRRRERAACRGIPVEPSTDCSTQDTHSSGGNPISSATLEPESMTHVSGHPLLTKQSGCQCGHPAASSPSWHTHSY